MSGLYVAVELDAVAMAPDVARSAAVSEDAVIAGLVRMWAWCWRSKKDTVDAVQLGGFFVGANTERLTAALQSFGFLEPADASLRVKGLDRYLRLAEARRKGGIAAKGNLKRGRTPAGGSAGGSAGDQPGVSRELFSGIPPAQAGLQPEAQPGDSRETAGGSPKTEGLLKEVSLTARKPSRQQEFATWYQGQAKIRVPGRTADEIPVKDLNVLLATPLDKVGREGLERAALKFFEDRWALERGLPLRVFLKQWPQHHNAAIATPPAPEKSPEWKSL